MSELKRLSRDSLPSAIEKARHYRLLNQPEQAESICLDVLDIDPQNQDALIIQILALTDLLSAGDPTILDRAQSVVPKLDGDYRRHYYAALICERQAMSLLRRRGRSSSVVAYQWFRDAQQAYEAAIACQTSGDDEAILRWNFCWRMISQHQLDQLGPEELADLGIE